MTQEANKPENRAKRPWIITYGHRPMYCSDDDGDDCLNNESLVRTGLPIIKAYVEVFLSQNELYGCYDKEVYYD